MSNHLFLDAAYPPSASDLLIDMAHVGADGCFLYIWGPIVNWTPMHKTILEASGFKAVPIIVPGDQPIHPDFMVKAVQAWGWLEGPVIFDFEQFSDPGTPWFANAVNIFAASGFRAEPYGTLSYLERYDPEDKDWVANWLRTGTLDPIPELPSGWEAWQFVNDVVVNGHTYDVSVVSDELLGVDMTPDQAKTLSDVNERTAALFNLLAYGNTGPLPDGKQFPLAVPFQAELDGISQSVAALVEHVATLPPGSGLTPDQATALTHLRDAVDRIEAALKGA